MDRRQFLQGSLGAAFAAPFLGDQTAPQGPPPSKAAEILTTYKPAPVTRKLVLDVHSRSLHWIRSADEVAEAAIEMVCGGVCPTVQDYPGHIDPAKVAQELPAFVKRVRSHGLKVTQIKGPAIRDLTEPNAERIIGAAAEAGCTHYSFGGYTYDFDQTARAAARLDQAAPRSVRPAEPETQDCPRL